MENNWFSHLKTFPQRKAQKVSLANSIKYLKKKIILQKFFQQIEKKKAHLIYSMELVLLIAFIKAKQMSQKKIYIPYEHKHKNP